VNGHWVSKSTPADEAKKLGIIVDPKLAPPFIEPTVYAPTRSDIGVLPPQFPHAFSVPVGGTSSFSDEAPLIFVSYGAIFYTDNFNAPRVTTFCAYKSRFSDTTFSICPVHNDMQ
jgi:hypothetical protein